ncbi:LamG-like jellyroll fold domain-containing protein [Streptomyces sp. KL116D]|uniref:LamG-like jellyroll fold domain-containing protein n=1 Tax=Streptomyces sp. KL116D TaxID=3045152 RepID=UPI003556F3B6
MEGIAGKAAKFDGTSGYAKIGQTSGPHINTERSFTVSAWAKLDKKPSGAAVITAQAGQAAPGFELYYSAAYDRWAFNQYSSDSAAATPRYGRCSPTAPLPGRVRTWWACTTPPPTPSPCT